MENCCRCDNPSAHAILVRRGELPNPFDPDTKKKDKTGLKVFRFCGAHWTEVEELLPGV